MQTDVTFNTNSLEPKTISLSDTDQCVSIDFRQATSSEL